MRTPVITTHRGDPPHVTSIRSHRSTLSSLSDFRLSGEGVSRHLRFNPFPSCDTLFFNSLTSWHVSVRGPDWLTGFMGSLSVTVTDGDRGTGTKSSQDVILVTVTDGGLGCVFVEAYLHLTIELLTSPVFHGGHDSVGVCVLRKEVGWPHHCTGVLYPGGVNFLVE
jgi:hypothetical protein